MCLKNVFLYKKENVSPQEPKTKPDVELCQIREKESLNTRNRNEVIRKCDKIARMTFLN